MGYAWLKQAMIGDWTGGTNGPWGPPATVNVDFKASGVYSAQCVGADSCSVWLDLRHDPSFDFTPTWLGNYGPGPISNRCVSDSARLPECLADEYVPAERGARSLHVRRGTTSGAHRVIVMTISIWLRWTPTGTFCPAVVVA